MGVVDHVLTDTSKEGAANHAQASASHHDLLSVLLFSDLADGLAWLAFRLYVDLMLGLYRAEEGSRERFRPRQNEDTRWRRHR